MQTFSTAFLNALNADHFEYAFLVDLPVGQHYTNRGYDLTVGTSTYLSNGLLVKFAILKRAHMCKTFYIDRLLAKFANLKHAKICKTY